MLKSLRSAVLLASLSGLAAAQSTWTVDPNGGGDFLVMQEAIDAAADGDLIEIAGQVSFGVIDGKSLYLQGVTESAGLVSAFGSSPALLVRNLAADQFVVARGLHFGALFPDPFEVVEVRSCDGAVHFEDSALVPGLIPTGSALGVGLVCDDAASVTLTRCTVRGGGGTFSHVSGLISIDSNVFVYDSTVSGGAGTAEHCELFLCVPAADAGPGLWVRGTSEVLLSNTVVSGGNAGCDPDSAAAPGIRIDDATAIARSRGSSITGGSNGGAGCPGTGAAPVEGPGTLTEPVGDPRSFAMSSPATAGGQLTMSFEGEAGDYAFLVYRGNAGADPALWFDPLFAVHLDLSQLGSLPIGFVGPSGVVDLAFDVPSFGPSPPFLSFSAQGVYATVDGPWITSGPSISLLIDGD